MPGADRSIDRSAVRGAVLEAVGQPVVIAISSSSSRGRGGPRADARLGRVPLGSARARRGVGPPDPHRDGARGRGRRRGGRAGRDVASSWRSRGAVVADPVRSVPVMPAGPRLGLPRLPVVPARPSGWDGAIQPCRYPGPCLLRHLHDGRGRGRPGRGRDPAPRGHRPGGRGAHWLLRDDRCGRRAQDRGRARGRFGRRHRARWRGPLVRHGRGDRRCVADRGHRPGSSQARNGPRGRRNGHAPGGRRPRPP